MSETTVTEPRSISGFLDVAIFLVMGAVIIQVSGYLAGGQSMLAGVIGVFGTLAIAWGLLAIRGQGWRDVGLRLPQSWLMTIVSAVLIAGFIHVVRDYLAPMLGSAPNLERFAPLEGNLVLLLQFMLGIWITAALFEELIYRGFILNRLLAGFGPGIPGAFLAALGQALIFGAVHWYQGWAGVILTGVGGFIFGAAYFLIGRNLWPLVLAHGFVNSYSLTMIFLFGVDFPR